MNIKKLMLIMKDRIYAYLCMLLTCGLLLSCEKVVFDEETTGTEGAQTANVVIRVADVEAGWGNNTSRTLVNVSEVCSRLNFAVYQNGSRVKYKNQAVGDSDFGTFSLELETGSYQLLVLAHSCKANPATTNPAKLQFSNPESSNGTGFTDTFYYYGDLVVDASGTQANISMKRATTMFRLVTSDVKPSSVKKFQFYYEGGSGALNAVTGLGCVDSKQSVFVMLDDAQTGQPLSFDMYTFLHAETGNVSFTVKAFDTNDDIKFEKEFTNVPMQRNCITRYTGSFFDVDDPTPPDDPVTPDPEEPASSVIMVDPEWGNIFDYSY